MKRSIISMLALCAMMNAQASYLFINVTDRGHVVEIDGQVIENNQSASIAEKASYKVVVKEDSGKVRKTIFTPMPSQNNPRTVVAITFGEILRRPYAKQYTLERAKAKYGTRIQFPK